MMSLISIKKAHSNYPCHDLVWTLLLRYPAIIDVDLSKL